MARAIELLSEMRVRKAKPQGKVTKGKNKGKPRTAVMLADGGGLYLEASIGEDGNVRRSWIFRYKRRGQSVRDMGLGSLNDIGLAEARELARECRKLVKEGIDPIKQREARIAQNLAASVAVVTFDQAADIYIREHRGSWKNPVHAAQWPSSLKTYASPIIGKLNVADIATGHIEKVLRPIWSEKPETASRVRGRIEKILGWATVSGHRTGPNPAAWKGHLENVFPAPGKVRKVEHQRALPYAEMPAFMSELRARTGMAALALEFTILTCVRTSDVRKARKTDIDHAKRAWIIPEFTKTHEVHRVPLSDAALAVLEQAEQMAREIGGDVAKSEFLFPNDVTGEPLSENAMLALLERMGRKGVMTTHGCRATFRTWAQEQTTFPWELCEMSLGHVVGDETERAYARGDGLRKRLTIMQAWADFCARPQERQSQNVTPINVRHP